MILLFIVLGLVVGSFLNVVIDRLPRGESLIKKRSHCDFCKHTLAWFDLVPIFSFFFLRGTCRYCNHPISIQYPLVELITSTLFVLAFIFLFKEQMTLALYSLLTIVYYLFIVSCFITIFLIDLKYGIIPDTVVYPAILFSFLYFLFTSPLLFLSHLFSAIGAFVFFFFLFAITRGRGMGFGDVKLTFLLGLFLGFPKIIVALYIAFLTGALVACILVLGRKKKFSGGTIPFGPFLILGTLVALLYGQNIWQYITIIFFR